MEEIEKKLWAKTDRYLRFLKIVPFLRMVTVCNNLSFSMVDSESDVDLFVVAKTGRLFFVRSFVTFVLHVLGVRRYANKVSGRFCLSFFVDDEALDLSDLAYENDIYLAFWIKSLVPVIDDGCADEFVKKNSWALSYFEDAADFRVNLGRVRRLGAFSRVIRGSLFFLFRGRFGDWIESKLKYWQMKRAKLKADLLGQDASVVVSDHVLKFHNVDRRREYWRLWKEKYGADKLTDEKFRSLKLYS